MQRRKDYSTFLRLWVFAFNFDMSCFKLENQKLKGNI